MPRPPPFQPAPGQTLEDFLTHGSDPWLGASGIVDLVDILEVEVDGVALRNLFAYRATSKLFTFTGDTSLQSFDSCITGTPQYGVSDGYWIMLPPLSKGQHTIYFHGGISIWGFESEVTYRLTVEPRKP